MLAETGSFEGGGGEFKRARHRNTFRFFRLFFFFRFLFKKILKRYALPFDPIDHDVRLRVVDRTIDTVYSSTDRF